MLLCWLCPRGAEGVARPAENEGSVEPGCVEEVPFMESWIGVWLERSDFVFHLVY